MTSPQDRREIGEAALFDMAGNAREWTRDLYRADSPGQDESWVQDGTRTFRAVRGLPLRAHLPSGTAVTTVAHRSAVCADGPCPPEVATELESVGFRCVRQR
jgi:formylglycine-generating enzyme required for sulfatase activity